jgi:hypothetical protein
MSTSAFDKASLITDQISKMSNEEREKISKDNMKQSQDGYVEFIESFKNGDCYICNRPLTSLSKKKPCIHWLLKPKGFKKNDLPDIAKHFGVFQIQTYLRWIANTQEFAKHINDLKEEGTGNKVIELTVRYRNLEWSFSCAESDYLGHQNSQHAKYPHYHFQIRIDKRPFINFSDFHLPLKEGDIISIETKRRLPHIVKHKFPYGEGMSEVLNDETVETLISQGERCEDEENASLHLDTIIMADEGTTISGEDIYNLIQEAKEKGVTISSLMHKLKNASAKTLVTAGPGVVEQALRSGRKKDYR